MTLGRKRNRFLAMAEGSVVAQFDDDDVYGAEYLDRMVAALLGDCLDAYDGVDDATLAAFLETPRLAQLASRAGVRRHVPIVCDDRRPRRPRRAQVLGRLRRRVVGRARLRRGRGQGV